jgi:microsomal dipeptidase-like Zn-dependent dipeptidase
MANALRNAASMCSSFRNLHDGHVTAHVHTGVVIILNIILALLWLDDGCQ